MKHEADKYSTLGTNEAWVYAKMKAYEAREVKCWVGEFENEMACTNGIE